MFKKYLLGGLLALVGFASVYAIIQPNIVSWPTATSIDGSQYYMIVQSGTDQRKILADDFATSISGTILSGTAIWEWSGNILKPVLNQPTQFQVGFNSDANGTNSVAIGFRVESSGYGSTALGGNTVASGGYSLAANLDTVANGDYSTALGDSSTANGEASVAMGYNSTTDGDFSLAMGFNALASSDYSVAIGRDVQAVGTSAIAIGSGLVASGKYNVLLGAHSTTDYNYSIAIGYLNTVTSGGQALGINNIVDCGAVAVGNTNVATGCTSFAAGIDNDTLGNYSTAIGHQNHALGTGSFAQGYSSTITGEYAVGMGEDINIPSNRAVAFGKFNEGLTTSVFELGYGVSDASRDNLMSVTNTGMVFLEKLPNYNCLATDANGMVIEVDCAVSGSLVESDPIWNSVSGNYLLVANSGDYYTTNPLGYITGGQVPGLEEDPIWMAASGNYLLITNSGDYFNTHSGEYFEANSGTYFETYSGDYFNIHSGEYYTTNPSGYITSGFVFGIIDTGFNNTGSDSIVLSEKFLRDYFAARDADFGDMLTTGGYYLSGDNRNRIQRSGTDLYFQNSPDDVTYNTMMYMNSTGVYGTMFDMGGNPYITGYTETDPVRTAASGNYAMINIYTGLSTGYVPYRNGSIFADSVIFNTGGMAGIGTETPIEALTVSGNVGFINPTTTGLDFRFARSGGLMEAQYYTGGAWVTAVIYTIP